jgi:hypothetical protein
VLRQKGHDPSVFYGNAVMVERAAVRFDRDDPFGVNQEIDMLLHFSLVC